MPTELTKREHALIDAAAKSILDQVDHKCHFPEEQRRELHELTEPGKERVKHLVEIADSARLVGIKADGHTVIFSVGRQVTIIGQKAIGAVLITILVFTVLGIIVAVGWKPLCALLGVVK